MSLIKMYWILWNIRVTAFTVSGWLGLTHITMCPYLGLCLFMLYLYDLFFIFSIIFIVINHITSFKQMHLFPVHFQNISYYFWVLTWMKKANSFQTTKVQPQGIAYKSVAYKKICAPKKKENSIFYTIHGILLHFMCYVWLTCLLDHCLFDWTCCVVSLLFLFSDTIYSGNFNSWRGYYGNIFLLVWYVSWACEIFFANYFFSLSTIFVNNFM